VLVQGVLVFFAFNAHFGFWKKENRQKDSMVQDSDESDSGDLVFDQEEAGEDEMDEMDEDK